MRRSQENTEDTEKEKRRFRTEGTKAAGARWERQLLSWHGLLAVKKTKKGVRTESTEGTEGTEKERRRFRTENSEGTEEEKRRFRTENTEGTAKDENVEDTPH